MAGSERSPLSITLPLSLAFAAPTALGSMQLFGADLGEDFPHWIPLAFIFAALEIGVVLMLKSNLVAERRIAQLEKDASAAIIWDLQDRLQRLEVATKVSATEE